MTYTCTEWFQILTDKWKEKGTTNRHGMLKIKKEKKNDRSYPCRLLNNEDRHARHLFTPFLFSSFYPACSNVISTSMQRWHIASTLVQRCIQERQKMTAPTHADSLSSVQQRCINVDVTLAYCVDVDARITLPVIKHSSKSLSINLSSVIQNTYHF